MTQKHDIFASVHGETGGGEQGAPKEEILRRKKAVALTYDNEENGAPVVVAAGTGYVAEKIVQVAEKIDIPVFQDDTAATLLYQLEIGQEIPEKLYEIVAQIFAYVMRVAGDAR